jgi:hypothetical protein
VQLASCLARPRGGELQRVANLLLEGRPARAQCVEVEIGPARSRTRQCLQPSAEPKARVTRERAPRAVLRAEDPEPRDAGPCPALAAGLSARTQEHARHAAAVADGRLGHHERDREEAARVLEEVAPGARVGQWGAPSERRPFWTFIVPSCPMTAMQRLLPVDSIKRNDVH